MRRLYSSNSYGPYELNSHYNKPSTLQTQYSGGNDRIRSQTKNAGSFIKCERLPHYHYTVPVLYTPKIEVSNSEICRDKHNGSLFKEKPCMKLCQGLPGLTEYVEVPIKNIPKQAICSYLSTSEMAVYKNLMSNMYGNKVNPQGGCDSPEGSRSHRHEIRVTDLTTQREPESLRSFVETNQRYRNTNYRICSHSETSNICVSAPYTSKRPVNYAKIQQDFPPSRNVRRQPNGFGNKSATLAIQSMNNSCKKVHRYTNSIKGYSAYGACYQQIRKTKEKTQEELLAETEFDELIAETKSTQTENDRLNSFLSKQTQTVRRLGNNHDKKLAKNSGKKNACSEANITVIIDRGWKEDIYCIAGGSLHSDTSMTKRKRSSSSIHAVDLFPVLPCISQPKTRTSSDENSQEHTRDMAVNTHISFCKKKMQPKAVSR